MTYEVKTARYKLKAFTGNYQLITSMHQALDAADLLKDHLEFTYAVLWNNSPGVISSIKQKFSTVSEEYKNVKDKADMTLVPAKECLLVVYHKMYKELKNLLRRSFKKGVYGEMQLNNTLENLYRAKNIVSYYFSQA